MWWSVILMPRWQRARSQAACVDAMRLPRGVARRRGGRGGLVWTGCGRRGGCHSCWDAPARRAASARPGCLSTAGRSAPAAEI